MKYLVTGAAGFIGMHVSAALLDKAGVRHFGNSELAAGKLTLRPNLNPANSEIPKSLTPDRAGWPSLLQDGCVAQ